MMSTPNSIQTNSSSRSSFDSMHELNIVNDTKNSTNQILIDDEVSQTFQGKLCFLDTQTINSYVDQFGQLFSLSKDANILHHLQQTALTGGLRSSCFRSVCWKIFLGILPVEQEAWNNAIMESRQQYTKICEEYEIEKNQKYSTNQDEDNPLSQTNCSWWNRHFQDKQLKSIIQQDVSRTFPEMDYFHDRRIQTLMQTVLFHYARQHPEVSYKQGMHELLAPLLFVAHCDQQAYEHAKENNLLWKDEHTCAQVEILMSDEHLEHDAFAMFDKLMLYVASWYMPEREIQTNKEMMQREEGVQPFSEMQEILSLSALGRRLRHINEQVLKNHDLELFNVLQSLQIEPQIYGIRWLRLLFGREFAIEELLNIWDAIFATEFKLFDYIFVAMLIVIRHLLLQGDYSESMSHLMRYPRMLDVHYIVKLAMHLQNPKVYQDPVNGYSHQVLPSSVLPSQFSKRSGLKELEKSKPQSKNIFAAGKKMLFFSKMDQFKNTEKKKIKNLILPIDFQRNSIANGPSSSESTEESFTSVQRNFCADHLESQIDILTQVASEFKFDDNPTNEDTQTNQNDLDRLVLAIAELKKIRDVLRGELLLENIRAAESKVIEAVNELHQDFVTDLSN